MLLNIFNIGQQEESFESWKCTCPIEIIDKMQCQILDSIHLKLNALRPILLCILNMYTVCLALFLIRIYGAENPLAKQKMDFINIQSWVQFS